MEKVPMLQWHVEETDEGGDFPDDKVTGDDGVLTKATQLKRRRKPLVMKQRTNLHYEWGESK